MIKRRIHILAYIILFTFMTLSGCGTSMKKSNNTEITGLQPQSAETNDNGGMGTQGKDAGVQEKITLDVWNYTEGLEYAVSKFEIENKNIKVNLVVFTFDEIREKYLTGLASGNGPDVLLIDSAVFPDFTGTYALQDLLEQPFDAGKYKEYFPEHLWNRTLSLDGKRQTALALNFSPKVTFYRADIMEQNGFPSEPEEFGRFIESQENLLNIAKKLKEQDIYIFQWANEPISEIISSATGVFDRNLNFLRNTDVFCKGMDLSKKIAQMSLSTNVSIFSDVGKSALKSGKIAMVYLGSWGSGTINSIAPGTLGKWRVTKLPFGLAGFSAGGLAAMNSESKKKEAAWKFIESIITHKYGTGDYTNIPGFKPVLKSMDMEYTERFLGGQKAFAFYIGLAEQIKEYPITPLDSKAMDIFYRSIDEAIYNNRDSEQTFSEITNKIEDALGDEKKLLLQFYGGE